MSRLRVERAAAVASVLAVLAVLSCRDEAAPAPLPAASLASSSASGAEPARLVLYPNAPNTLWGAAQFFDPDRSRPATKVAHGPVKATPTLDPEAIERMMRDKENELLYCYWGILKDKPGLQGRVIVSINVAADGKVTSASDQGSDVAAPHLIGCVAKTLEAGEMNFPPTGKAGTVVYTLTFSPG